MATFTQNLADRFPAGTSVGAYLKSNWGKGELPPSGAPKGPAAATATVAADGTLTLTGLSYSTDYYLTNSTGSLGYVSVNLGPAPASGGTPGPSSITRQMLTPSARDTWLPSGAVAQNFPWLLATGATGNPLSTGRLTVVGGVTLPGGVAASAITFVSGTTAAGTPTHQWFALVRVSDRAVLGATADDLTTAWAANTPKTLTLSAAYTPAQDEQVWVGIMVAAATVPTLVCGPSLPTSTFGMPPLWCGNGPTGLTTPASLTSPVAAPSAAGPIPYCYVS